MPDRLPVGRGQGGSEVDIDPHLPDAWGALGVRLRFHGQAIRVRAEHDRFSIDCAEPLTVRVAGEGPLRCDPPGRVFAIERSKQ